MKRMLLMMIVHFRPYLSFKGSCSPAPKKDPAWKSETMLARALDRAFLDKTSSPNSRWKEGKAKVPANVSVNCRIHQRACEIHLRRNLTDGGDNQ